jgi:phage head maturation protease
MEFDGYTRAYGREHAMDGARGFLPESIMAKVRAFREQAECAECGHRIGTHLDMAIRGKQTYHPSCAERYDARHITTTTTRTSSSRSIGFIHGTCAHFGRAYPFQGIPEAVQPWSFSRAIARGGIALRMDHDELRTIPCDLTFCEGQHELRFYATIHDTPIGRKALHRVERGDCRGTSLGFHPPTSKHNDSRIGALVYDDLNVVELSLCFDKHPAWAGTSVRGVLR